jgi:Ca2+-binding EF-hand superfamily protein
MNLTEPENSVLDEVYDDLDENGDGTVDMQEMRDFLKMILVAQRDEIAS